MSVYALSLDVFDTHAGTVHSTQPLKVESIPAQWAYTISFQVPLSSIDAPLPLLVGADVVVEHGSVGICVVAGDLTTMLGRVPLPATSGRHRLELLVEQAAESARLVFQNHTSGDRPCVFTVESISVGPAPPGGLLPPSRLDEVTEGSPRRIDTAKLRKAIESGGFESHDDPAMVGLNGIDIVSVDEIHQRLGVTRALKYPAESRRKSLLDWKMEVDDSPILRYLYRMLRPRRHLEFGTWEGTGACYCLEESQATVWTLNLAEGESIDGGAAYTEALESVPPGASPIRTEQGRDFYQTDAGVFIGHRYREAGFGHRVCQVYCDSRQWDTSAYPSDFFDTVLIDGGHTEDVVVSDSTKAFAVTRPGGVIMWHDFCPDPAVFAHAPSVAGVIAGLTKNWTDFAPKLQDVFWVQPSFLLLGIRGE